MYLVLFLPYIGEYVFSLFTITEVSRKGIERNRKKIEILKNENLDKNLKKIEKLNKSIEESEKFLKTNKVKENRKIIFSKNENSKWLFLIMIIATLGALITPIGFTPITYYLKTSVRNYNIVYIRTFTNYHCSKFRILCFYCYNNYCNWLYGCKT